MFESVDSWNIEDDPKAKKKSCIKVLGRQRPNPSFHKTLASGKLQTPRRQLSHLNLGVRMPVGSSISGPIYQDGKRISAYSDYNEYIVKNVSNTVVRYLVKFQS